ncbi:MAG TPA: hypothetical protein DD454_03305 [Candidatus Moranbacteria bacterium]|nr:hypothetical protein [Candidatus Moranbacteria bacterium]
MLLHLDILPWLIFKLLPISPNSSNRADFVKKRGTATTRRKPRQSLSPDLRTEDKTLPGFSWEGF